MLLNGYLVRCCQQKSAWKDTKKYFYLEQKMILDKQLIRSKLDNFLKDMGNIQLKFNLILFIKWSRIIGFKG